MIGTRKINAANATGRNIFHVSDISRSYRSRGRAPRAQMNIALIIMVIIPIHIG